MNEVIMRFKEREIQAGDIYLLLNAIDRSPSCMDLILQEDKEKNLLRLEYIKINYTEEDPLPKYNTTITEYKTLPRRLLWPSSGHSIQLKIRKVIA